MLDEQTRGAILAVRDEAAARGTIATFALHREQSHLMRIGNNSVSLNTSESLTRLDIQVTEGRRQSTHTHLGQLAGPADVRAALDIAVAKVRVSMDKDYQPPEDVVEEPVDERPQHDPAQADLEPAVKADAYRRIIAAAGNAYTCSGAWSSGATERYLVTTANRNEAWHLGTDSLFTVVCKHLSGRWEVYDTQTGWRAADFDVARTLGRIQALLPVYEQSAGESVAPGHYTVLLGAEALAEVVGLAMWTGLYGRSWEEKTAWTAQNQAGDAILGANVTLVDDPACDDTFRIGFDMTGKRRRRFVLVEDGRLVQLMYDSNTAAKYGRTATPHSTGSPSITMRTGDGPADPLAAVRGMGRVLYVPALHYTGIPNPSEGLFTASSRFNAVLVEDGRVVRPIFSTRITDTFRNVLGNIRVLAGQAESVNQSNTYGRRSPVSMSVPAYAVVEGVRITDSADAF